MFVPKKPPEFLLPVLAALSRLAIITAAGLSPFYDPPDGFPCVSPRIERVVSEYDAPRAADPSGQSPAENLSTPPMNPRTCRASVDNEFQTYERGRQWKRIRTVHSSRFSVALAERVNPSSHRIRVCLFILLSLIYLHLPYHLLRNRKLDPPYRTFVRGNR